MRKQLLCSQSVCQLSKPPVCFCVFALCLLALQVAKDLGDSVQILKLDVDKNPSMSTRLQVRLMWHVCLPPPHSLSHASAHTFAVHAVHLVCFVCPHFRVCFVCLITLCLGLLLTCPICFALCADPRLAHHDLHRHHSRQACVAYRGPAASRDHQEHHRKGVIS